MIFSTKHIEAPRKSAKITFAMIQRFIKDTYNIDVSKSSITEVKKKCGIDQLEKYTRRNVENIALKSEKEKLVIDAFKHFHII